jgi:hypothetical protein
VRCLVEDLEGLIRDHISAEMPTQPGYLEGKSLVHLMIDYRVWRERFVQPCRRRVHRSAEMNESPSSAEHAEALADIEAKLAGGEDIEAHLSFRIRDPLGDGGQPSDPLHKRRDRDLLLAQWGVHHLHLSARPHHRKQGFVERTDEVLFAVFREADVYLLGIYAIPSMTIGPLRRSSPSSPETGRKPGWSMSLDSPPGSRRNIPMMGGLSYATLE